MTAIKTKLFPKIHDTIKQLDVTTISETRKTILQSLIDLVQLKTDTNQIINLNFICTHNSRRSHLSQVWAQTMVSYFNIKNVFCYSGGTEATALFPIAALTLKNTGFEILMLSNTENPVYSIKYAENQHSIIGFSKTYDSEFNPKSEFAAILTCSSADKGCPFISGAEKRIPVMYDDPKAFDNTPLQIEKYQERSLQIATELKYVFSKINTK